MEKDMTKIDKAECVVDGGCKPVKDITDKLKSYSRTAILIVLTVGGSYAYTWSKANDVPELKQDGKNREARLTVVETNQKTVLKDIDEIKKNQQIMMGTLSEIKADLKYIKKEHNDDIPKDKI